VLLKLKIKYELIRPMTNLAIIPARSGSQRTIHKNIKLVAGHPLIYYSIQCAKQVNQIDKIVVATDSEYYAEIAQSYGVDIIMRPAEISGSHARIEETMIYVLDQLSKAGENFENVILIQATCPLGKPQYIEEGLNLIGSQDCKSVVSFQDFRGFFLDDDNLLERPRIQDLKTRELEAGAFWITNVQAFRDQKNRICPPFKKVLVDDLSALDIDHPHELKLIEGVLNHDMALQENRYYRKREYAGNFEESYYGPKKDPDGKLRDITQEKSEKIDFFKEEITFINELGADGKKRRILDLGCGVGFVSSALVGQWETYGLEVSSMAAEQAKKFISHIHVGYLEADTYENEFFDVIQCHHVIEHVKNPEEFISYLHGCLKTHGHLVLSTPNFGCGAARYFGDNFRLLHDETHIALFDDFSLKGFLENYGFIVDSIKYPYFDTPYFNKENLLRMLDPTKMSPAFYGNIMSFYCRKK